MFGGYAAFQFLVTLYVQGSLGWSPISMAVALLPTGLIVVASATKIHLVFRFSTPVLVGAGLVAFGTGYLCFLRTSPGMSYWTFMFPTMVLLGIGFALVFPAINSQATAGVVNRELELTHRRSKWLPADATPGR